MTDKRKVAGYLLCLALLFIVFIQFGVTIAILVKYGPYWTGVSVIVVNMFQLLQCLIMSLPPCANQKYRRQHRILFVTFPVYYVIHVPVLVILILGARSCDLKENKYNCKALKLAEALFYFLHGWVITLCLSIGQGYLISTCGCNPSEADQTSRNNQTSRNTRARLPVTQPTSRTNRTVCTRPSRNPQVRLPVREPPSRNNQTVSCRPSSDWVEQLQSRWNVQPSPAKLPSVYTLPLADNNIRHASENNNLWDVSTYV